MEMKKVLIIDKDIEFAKTEKAFLELSGLEVQAEADGKIGLKYALNKDVQLVITEQDLDGISGTEICKEIKRKKKIPVVFTSARGEEMDIIAAFCIGANDYMVKPFNVNELVARVRALLDLYDDLLGTSNQNYGIIEIDRIRIDKTFRMVFVDGVEKNFTSKEYELLIYLAEHPNKVYSKEELFREIWDMDSVGDIATVTVHIKKLREKIEKDPSNPKYIETIWGVGYRFKII